MKTRLMRLISILAKNTLERRVKARGLHDFQGNRGFYRPGALTVRVLRQAVSLAVLASVSAFAQNIPSDGTDGDFSPTNDIVVDLSLARPGAWDASNTANAGKGVYDSNKWAVVFKYSSVNIPAGVTVTFSNHATHAPVVWLVESNVTINGTVSVAGHDSLPGDPISLLTPAEPSPGGFQGGAGGPSGEGAGYGPGSAPRASYASSYGNPQIIPLIGGSGAGWGADSYYSPGGGGGALLVDAVGISVNGTVNADGGNYYSSGGAIRLVAAQVSGNGQIHAKGNGAGDGRIRIETLALDQNLRITPTTIAVAPAPFPIIWPADDAPTVRVVTVDGTAPQGDPTAPLSTAADVPIQNNGTVQVVLETKNFPVEGSVQVRSVQKYGPAAWVAAAFSSGNFAQSTWIANITFAPGFTTLQARATVP